MADGQPQHLRDRGMRGRSSLIDTVPKNLNQDGQYLPRPSLGTPRNYSYGPGPTDSVRQTTGGRGLVRYVRSNVRHTPMPETDYFSHRPERHEPRSPSRGRSSTPDPGLDSVVHDIIRRRADARKARAAKPFPASLAEDQEQRREQTAEKHNNWRDRPRSKERKSVNWDQNLPKYEREQHRIYEMLPDELYGRQQQSELDEDSSRRTEYQKPKRGWSGIRMPAITPSIDEERRITQREIEEHQSAIADNWSDIDALLGNAARLRRSLKDIWIRHEEQEQSDIEALQADLARLRRLDLEIDPRSRPPDGWIRREQQERSANEALLRHAERVRHLGYETVSRSLTEEMLREQHERDDRFQKREQDRWRNLMTILSSIDREIRLMRTQGSRQQMRHHSSDSSVSSGSSSEASQYSKDDRGPRNGSTRFPHHLVSQRALIDLGYPYYEEGNTIVVSKPLDRKHIKNVLNSSRYYRDLNTHAITAQHWTAQTAQGRPTTSETDFRPPLNHLQSKQYSVFTPPPSQPPPASPQPRKQSDEVIETQPSSGHQNLLQPPLSEHGYDDDIVVIEERSPAPRMAGVKADMKRERGTGKEKQVPDTNSWLRMVLDNDESSADVHVNASADHVSHVSCTAEVPRTEHLVTASLPAQEPALPATRGQELPFGGNSQNTVDEPVIIDATPSDTSDTSDTTTEDFSGQVRALSKHIERSIHNGIYHGLLDSSHLFNPPTMSVWHLPQMPMQRPMKMPDHYQEQRPRSQSLGSPDYVSDGGFTYSDRFHRSYKHHNRGRRPCRDLSISSERSMQRPDINRATSLSRLSDLASVSSAGTSGDSEHTERGGNQGLKTSEDRASDEMMVVAVMLDSSMHRLREETPNTVDNGNSASNIDLEEDLSDPESVSSFHTATSASPGGQNESSEEPGNRDVNSPHGVEESGIRDEEGDPSDIYSPSGDNETISTSGWGQDHGRSRRRRFASRRADRHQHTLTYSRDSYGSTLPGWPAMGLPIVPMVLMPMLSIGYPMPFQAVRVTLPGLNNSYGSQGRKGPKRARTKSYVGEGTVSNSPVGAPMPPSL